ncbi:methylamine utilization protein [uncultured Sphaerotilus sp.]|uniref:methylamine utilization protein n=1 Tax=uncultured Sphaerotilus sp. TaxID=474984 RepID=UPI0030CA5047
MARRLLGPAVGLAVGLALPGWVLAAAVTVQALDPAGKPLTGAVVAIEVGGVARVAAPGTRAEISQRQRSFEPGLLVVQTGTAVDFPNLDTVRHHVYSFSPARTFELKLYNGRPSTPVVFDRAGVVVLGCNIHDQMIGAVVVVDTPLFGRTDAAGRVVLEVPAGEHRLRTWHPRMREGTDLQVQPLKVGAAGTPSVVVALPVVAAP